MPLGAMWRIVSAWIAGDLKGCADRPTLFTDDTDIPSALGKMIESSQAILPAINNERKLIDDLRISEILNAVLETGAQSAEGTSSRPVRS